MELIIGSHVSYKDRLYGCVMEALEYGANTFMFYTGAPQNTKRFPINIENRDMAYELMNKNGIDINNVIVHAPYIINLANTANIEFSKSFLRQEIERCKVLGITKLVLHPGSHIGLGPDVAIQNIADALNEVLKEDDNIIICIETMAGKGTEVGKTFDEIKSIVDKINLKDKVGVCLDTCHINDAGYDLTSIDDVLENFDKVIGLDNLKCIHINDSKNPISAHKDRHENIGFGTIGFKCLMDLVYHPKLKGIPKILETPYLEDESGNKVFPPYKYEIEMIRNNKFDPDLKEKIINQM